MPLDIALDTDIHDVAIVDGDIALVRGRELHRQEVVQLLHLYAGEWFLNQTIGVDYKNRVRGKQDPVIRDAEIKRAIKAVPGVIRLLDFTAELDPQTRRLDWDFDADLKGEEAEEPTTDFQAATFTGDPALGTRTLERTDSDKTSDHTRPRPGYLLDEDSNFRFNVQEGDISHDRIDQSTVDSDDHHKRYTDAEARAAAAAHISRYKVPLSDIADGNTETLYLLHIPSGADVDIKGLGVHTDSATTSSNLSIAVRELGGSQLVSTTDLNDPKGVHVDGAADLAVDLTNNTGSKVTAGGFVDFLIEFDAGPDEVGRYAIPLADVNDGNDLQTHLIHVPDGNTAEISRAGVHLEDGTAPTGLELFVDQLGGANVLSTTNKSDTFSASINGPENLIVRIDNTTGANVVAGGFVNVEFL